MSSVRVYVSKKCVLPCETSSDRQPCSIARPACHVCAPVNLDATPRCARHFLKASTQNTKTGIGSWPRRNSIYQDCYTEGSCTITGGAASVTRAAVGTEPVGVTGPRTQQVDGWTTLRDLHNITQHNENMIACLLVTA
jgi:hypothetical protein